MDLVDPNSPLYKISTHFEKKAKWYLRGAALLGLFLLGDDDNTPKTQQDKLERHASRVEDQGCPSEEAQKILEGSPAFCASNQEMHHD